MSQIDYYLAINQRRSAVSDPTTDRALGKVGLRAEAGETHALLGCLIEVFKYFLLALVALLSFASF